MTSSPAAGDLAYAAWLMARQWSEADVTYRFVQAATDLGPRKGPILGANVHMAEGGGTVGFLSRPNRDGVSVQYVIDYDGIVTQMLLESHMQSAIRIHNPDGSYAIRQDDDGFGFGHSVAVAVLGAWADTHTTLGPNHATIGIELEGFAGKAPLKGEAGYDPRADPLGGPNDAQTAALAALIDDIRTRHADIGLTGHRDHNVKNCPGLRIPWLLLGGHGPAGSEAPMKDIDAANATPLVIAVDDGTEILNLDGSARQTAHGDRPNVYSPFGTTSDGGTALRAIVWTRPDPDPDLVLAIYGNAARNIRPLEATGITEAEAAARSKAAVAAALDHVKAAHDAEGVAIDEAYLR
jgi:hypothetical protein